MRGRADIVKGTQCSMMGRSRPALYATVCHSALQLACLPIINATGKNMCMQSSPAVAIGGGARSAMKSGRRPVNPVQPCGDHRRSRLICFHGRAGAGSQASTGRWLPGQRWRSQGTATICRLHQKAISGVATRASQVWRRRENGNHRAAPWLATRTSVQGMWSWHRLPWPTPHLPSCRRRLLRRLPRAAASGLTSLPYCLQAS